MCRDGEGHFPSWSGLALMLHTWGCDAVLLGWCAVESFGVGLLRDRKHLAHRFPILKSSKAKSCPTVTVYHMYLKTLRYKTLTLQDSTRWRWSRRSGERAAAGANIQSQKWANIQLTTLIGSH